MSGNLLARLRSFSSTRTSVWADGVHEDDLVPIRPAADLVDRDTVDRILAGGYNAVGIAAWWNRPRTRLNGRTPAEAWADDREAVLELARAPEGPGEDK